MLTEILIEYVRAHPHLSVSRVARYRRVAQLLKGVESPEDVERVLCDGRCRNTAANMMHAVRAASAWAVRTGLADRNPFAAYRPPHECYGAPVYLTPAERRAVEAVELEGVAAVHRDIFVFQCYTGCRVSDLRALTKDNVYNDTLEYIPMKTRRHRAEAVRVPLHPKAVEIIERYRGGERLLPCRCVQRYNEGIRKVCRIAGLDRPVWSLDDKGNPVSRPLWMVASSHMARRTFVGTLYGMVQDPALISSMSGHAPNSPAFLRYRCVSDAMKRGLIERM